MPIDSFRENPGIQRFPKNEQEWKHWINEVNKWIASQTSVEAAARSSVTHDAVPAGGVYWRTDPSGVYPASNPTYDITLTFYDQEGTQVAQRVLRGTLTSATGVVTGTNVSSSASTGYSTAVSFTNNGSDSVLGTVTLSLPDNTEYIAQVSWTSADHSTAGSSPASGGGK